MTGLDRFRAAIDACVTMAKLINDHYDELKAAGVDVLKVAEDMKKIIAFCQAQKKKAVQQ